MTRCDRADCELRRYLRVLHQVGLNPVVVPLLQDPIGDGSGIFRYLKPLAEGFGEALQHRPGQTAQGGEDLAGGGRVEGREAGIDVGAWGGGRGAAMD